MRKKTIEPKRARQKLPGQFWLGMCRALIIIAYWPNDEYFEIRRNAEFRIRRAFLKGGYQKMRRRVWIIMKDSAGAATYRTIHWMEKVVWLIRRWFELP